jgi:hypothetical protein
VPAAGLCNEAFQTNRNASGQILAEHYSQDDRLARQESFSASVSSDGGFDDET